MPNHSAENHKCSPQLISESGELQKNTKEGKSKQHPKLGGEEKRSFENAAFDSVDFVVKIPSRYAQVFTMFTC